MKNKRIRPIRKQVKVLQGGEKVYVNTDRFNYNASLPYMRRAIARALGLEDLDDIPQVRHKEEKVINYTPVKRKIGRPSKAEVDEEEKRFREAVDNLQEIKMVWDEAIPLVIRSFFMGKRVPEYCHTPLGLLSHYIANGTVMMADNVHDIILMDKVLFKKVVEVLEFWTKHFGSNCMGSLYRKDNDVNDTMGKRLGLRDYDIDTPSASYGRRHCECYQCDSDARDMYSLRMSELTMEEFPEHKENEDEFSKGECLTREEYRELNQKDYAGQIEWLTGIKAKELDVIQDKKPSECPRCREREDKDVKDRDNLEEFINECKTWDIMEEIKKFSEGKGKDGESPFETYMMTVDQNPRYMSVPEITPLTIDHLTESIRQVLITQMKEDPDRFERTPQGYWVDKKMKRDPIMYSMAWDAKVTMAKEKIKEREKEKKTGREE